MYFLSELYKQEIVLIRYIQNKFIEHEGTMHSISEWGDPGYAFTILLPVIASCNTMFGIEFLVALIFSDWFNMLLKWLLMEDRPYWWIKEADVYNKQLESVPILHQTSATCQTGPGSPSGHVMVSASLLYVIVQWWIHRYDNRIHSFHKKIAAKVFIWSLYGLALISIAISRLYVATHFPHQCVLGAILGFLTAYILVNNKSFIKMSWKNYSCWKLLTISFTMCIISIGAYWLQKISGIDPQWSIKLAFKWCEVPENIHVSTTPLYVLVRDCGTMFGLAAILPLANKFKTDDGLAIVRVAVTLIMSFIWFTVQQSAPTYNVALYYTVQFITHAIQPILLLGVVPYISNEKQKQK